MSKKDNNCALCGSIPQKEEPAILTLGSYGYPRCLCEICEQEIDTATLGRDYDEIAAAIASLGTKMTTFGKDDKMTVKTMETILEAAAKRATAIKEGSYDFALDEATEEDSFDEIPEELRETEEDKALDKKDEEFNKKFDKVLNWLWLFVLLGAVVVLLLKFVFKVI